MRGPGRREGPVGFGIRGEHRVQVDREGDATQGEKTGSTKHDGRLESVSVYSVVSIAYWNLELLLTPVVELRKEGSFPESGDTFTREVRGVTYWETLSMDNDDNCLIFE